MNIKIVLKESINNELMFNIVDCDTNKCVGYLFTVGDHVAYEVKKEYRCQGIATSAVKQIIKKIKHPVLEITFNNIASQKVAEKAGFTLVRVEQPFGIYEVNKSRKTR